MTKQVVAALQVGSSPKGTKETLKKILSYEQEVKEKGVKILVLPEAILGGYPKGSNFGTYLGFRLQEGKEEFKRYFKEAIDLDGEEIRELAKFSNRTGAFITAGVIERAGSTLYCTMVYIDPVKGYVGKHRKLQPTGTERLIWGQGDGSTLTTVQTSAGTLGGAICWENFLPLLRQAMYAKGVQVWAAPTVDGRKIWGNCMQTLGYEGRLFVVSAVQFMPPPKEMGYELKDWDENENCINGGSLIVDPYGEVLAGPFTGKEGLLHAEIDLDKIIEARFDFDPVGHYARGDVFQLTVNERSRDVTFTK
ncbi:BA75_05225T0 [Komagataella pastoris]|uniref:BA75_05225T0 n=1 Tax=Komagataella pastoris TaxID=4922 RepID=A0A1B2JH03_PICPA|nr:BA75_05225T0 [Komagataella pastoris]